MDGRLANIHVDCDVRRRVDCQRTLFAQWPATTANEVCHGRSGVDAGGATAATPAAGPGRLGDGAANVEPLHQPALLEPVLLAADAGGPGGRSGVHPRLPHDLDQLEPEGGDVVLDLVDVVLGDALGLGLALLLGHVAPDQVPHHVVVAEVTLAGLPDTSLEYAK